MVLILLAARASPMLSFDSEMDDKLCCIVLYWVIVFSHYDQTLFSLRSFGRAGNEVYQ